MCKIVPSASYVSQNTFCIKPYEYTHGPYSKCHKSSLVLLTFPLLQIQVFIDRFPTVQHGIYDSFPLLQIQVFINRFLTVQHGTYDSSCMKKCPGVRVCYMRVCLLEKLYEYATIYVMLWKDYM